MVHRIVVEDQSLRWYGRPPKIADDSIEFVRFQFHLPEEWASLVLVAQFTQADTYNMLLGEGMCFLPKELKAGLCKLSLFGYAGGKPLRATSIPLVFQIEESGFVSSAETPIPPTPDLYAQLIDYFSSIAGSGGGGSGSGTINPEDIAAAVEDYLSKNPPEVPDLSDEVDRAETAASKAEAANANASASANNAGSYATHARDSATSAASSAAAADKAVTDAEAAAARAEEAAKVTTDLDTTLTQAGKAADAKAVGDAISKLSGGNVDLSGYLKLPTNEDGTPNHGTAGYYAVSDGAGGITWVASGNTGGDDSGDTETNTHGIVWDLVNVTSNNNAVSVSDGSSLVAVLTPSEGYTLGDVTVTMGGEVLTGVWNEDTQTVMIVSVTGDVVISCAGVEQGTADPVDTSPVIAQQNMAYESAASTTLAKLATRTGMCVTKPYTFPSLADKFKELGTYDEETGKLTDVSYSSKIAYYIPNTKYVENAEANGYPTSSVARYFKIAYLKDETIVSFNNNSSYGTSIVAYANVQSVSRNDSANINAIAFTLSMDDAEDSYAFWTKQRTSSVREEKSILPDGVREGDIIFAGKNTPYYGMANIDGTLPGQTATAELSYDDDVAQNYAVATTSVLGDEPVADASTAYGISTALAEVITTAKKEWMTEYGGDYRKIPIIVSTDQHGRRNEGIFNLIGKTFSMYDVSKAINLGDTVSTWYDSDTAHPLLSCDGLEAWCESVKSIPFSKQLNVFGNHDTWYGNYADEGNPVGTRYPSSQAHLYQYFRNIYARRTNNNGWFVVYDDAFNVKYVVFCPYEYKDGSSILRISTAQMTFAVEELSKNDGYDIVLVSHAPYQLDEGVAVDPTGAGTPGTYSELSMMTDLVVARRNKTAGTITDSESVEHSFDFTGCTTDLLCSLHGHTHVDAYQYLGDSMMQYTFDWFDENTIFFALLDRVNRVLNIWKVEGDALTYTNYQVPFDKATE